MREEEERDAAESIRQTLTVQTCLLLEGILEHAGMLACPRWTSDGTETQGHGVACPDSPGWSGDK